MINNNRSWNVGIFRSSFRSTLQNNICGGLMIVLSFFSFAYSWKIPWKPFSSSSDSTEMKSNDTRIIGRFFDETFAHSGYQYSYPEGSSVSVSNETAHQGRVSLLFNLDANNYSGGSVCLQDKVYNLKQDFQKAALQFWIKGAVGSEKGWVALVDEEKIDGRKTVVRLEIDWFGGIGTEWSLISIPLKHFGENGVYWDEKDQREIDSVFDWDKVAEFRIEVKKGDNKSFRVWIDDIVIVKVSR